MQLGELSAECGFEGFGVFVDYAIVAIVELCVMENLVVPLVLSIAIKVEGVRGRGQARYVPAHNPSQSPRRPYKSCASNFATSRPSAPTDRPTDRLYFS